jgi:hypothetical protein
MVMRLDHPFDENCSFVVRQTLANNEITAKRPKNGCAAVIE